ncbi:cyclase [Candidatus Peregrinibacteria bacterium CG_4_9_14_0_2_um_filter_53_11]|nr:MAG: cyclase [Candidatus Peregrinibacteria bacterium CG_4_9_14_0_2_um_filter_53_11]
MHNQPWIDLTHPITETMPVFPGDPPPQILKTATIEKEGYNEFSVTCGTHTGTHVDAPWHMLEDGASISGFTLNTLCGPAQLIDARGKSKIDSELFTGRQLSNGDRVLIMTGHSATYGTASYYEDFPELTTECANLLADSGVTLVGLDTPSPDRAPFKKHHILMRARILIIENLMGLEKLSSFSDVELIALPLNLQTDAAPARVIARGISP